MTVVYATTLLLGVLALMIWMIVTALAGNLGRDAMDPDRRFGKRGRSIVAGALAFGLGGLSATFAGWSAGLAIMASVAAAAFFGWYAVTLGVHTDDEI